MRLIYFVWGLILISMVVCTFLISCDDNGGKNPVSFVNGYQPQYTEQKGTVHAGNFLPIAAGKVWNYQGTMSGYTKLSMSGTYAGEKINETYEDTLSSSDCIALSQILTAVSATLSGKSYMLYPELGYADLGMSDTYIEPEIIRYYDVSDSVVFIRAIPGDQELMEVTDPVFVKSKLVVGDSWSSYPTVNTANSLSAETTDIEMNAQCKIFVVGMDTIGISYYVYIPFPILTYKEVPAVQLDEVAQFSGTVKSSEYGDATMKISGKAVVYLYLGDGIGIVQAQEHLELSMNGTVSDQYGTVKISLSMDIDDMLTLSQGSVAIPPTPLAKGNQTTRLFKNHQDKIPQGVDHIVQEITRLINFIRL